MSDVNINIEALKQLKAQLEDAIDSIEQFCTDTAKELAARLLRKAIKRTPVGVKPDASPKILQEHWSGYQGGTLRKNWSAGSVEQAGSTYTVEIKNNTVYASYVEYGHRQEVGRFVPQLGKRLTKGFVEGKHMLRISEQELRNEAPAIIERRINNFLKGAMSPDK